MGIEISLKYRLTRKPFSQKGIFIDQDGDSGFSGPLWKTETKRGPRGMFSRIRVLSVLPVENALDTRTLIQSIVVNLRKEDYFGTPMRFANYCTKRK